MNYPPLTLPNCAAGPLNDQLDVAVSDDLFDRIGESGGDFYSNEVIGLNAGDSSVSQLYFENDSAFTPVVVQQPMEFIQFGLINRIDVEMQDHCPSRSLANVESTAVSSR